MSYTRTLSEDWLKASSWDFPTDFDAFCSTLGHAPNSPRFPLWLALRKVTTLPAWKAAPVELVEKVNAFLGKPPPGTR